MTLFKAFKHGPRRHNIPYEGSGYLDLKSSTPICLKTDKHATTPAIRPMKPSAIPPGDQERDSTPRMRFMELNAPLKIEFCWLKVPHGSGQLLGGKLGGIYGVKEVSSCHLAGRHVDGRVEEDNTKHLQSARVDSKHCLGILAACRRRYCLVCTGS